MTVCTWLSAFLLQLPSIIFLPRYWYQHHYHQQQQHYRPTPVLFLFTYFVLFAMG